MNQRTCILIIGMHRSGTSATAGCMSKLGYSLGNNLMVPNEFNPKGYFENQAVYEFNEEILAEFSLNWKRTALLPENWWLNSRLNKNKERLKQILLEEFGSSDDLLLKDPRISKLLPFYLSVFDELNIVPKVIINFRNPLEVAESLKNRDNLSIPYSINIYNDSILSILNYTNKVDMIFLGYSELLKDPVNALKTIINKLKLNKEITNGLSEQIKLFIEPKLKHHEKEVTQKNEFPDVAIKLYRILERNDLKLADAEVYSEISLLKKDFYNDYNFYNGIEQNTELRLDIEYTTKTKVTRYPVRIGFNSFTINTDPEGQIRKIIIYPVSAQTALNLIELASIDSNDKSEELPVNWSNSEFDSANGLYIFETETPKLVCSIDDNSKIRKIKISISYLTFGQSTYNTSIYHRNNYQNKLIDDLTLLSDKRKSLEIKMYSNEYEYIAKRNELENNIIKLNKSIADLRLKINELNNTKEELITSNKEVKSSFEELKNSKDELKISMENEIKQQNKYFNEQLHERQKEIIRLIEKKENIETLFRAKESEARLYKSTLDSMYSSNSWRMARFFRYLRRKFVVGKQILKLILKLVINVLTLRKQDVKENLKNIRDIYIIKRSGVFDFTFYYESFPDIAASKFNGIIHYVERGAAEGRNPNSEFNTNEYLKLYDDVKAFGINPFAHYLKFGKKEGRTQNRTLDSYPKTDKQTYSDQKKYELNKFLSNDRRLSFNFENPQISVILVLFNKAELTLACLKSLKKNADVPIEIIIVDNGSTDLTHDLLDKIKVSKTIKNKKNLHFLRACNQAAKYAKAPTILFLNNDTEIQVKSLSNAVTTLNEDELNGAVGGKLILPDGTLQEAGSIIWADGSCLGYGRGKSPLDYEYNFKRVVDYCSGAFLLTHTSLFEKHGGFDTQFEPAYYEETDYCLWLQENGYRVIYEPQSEVMHFEFGSSGLDSGQDLQKKNHKKFYKKHFDQLAKHYNPSLANIIKARFAASEKGKLRILYIDDRIPYPSLGAGYPRANKIVKILSSLGNNVTVFPNTFPYESTIENSYTGFDRSIEMALGIGAAKFSSFMEERKGYYDIVWISRPHNMELCRSVLEDHKKDLKIIYDAEAVFADRTYELSKLQGKPLTEDSYNKLVNKELALCEIADSIVAVSDNDAKKFMHYGYNNVHVLGHAIENKTATKTFNERKDLLFVGNLDILQSPNVDSIIWFVKDILPLIKQKIPGIKLHVVGSCNAKEIQKLESDIVHVHGRVDEISDLYNNCRVFIAPTRFAAGIPYKIHEASAYGLPSVATNILVKQLGWEKNKHIVESKIDCADFANATLKLYTDEILWNKIRSEVNVKMESENSESVYESVVQQILYQNLK